MVLLDRARQRDDLVELMRMWMTDEGRKMFEPHFESDLREWLSGDVIETVAVDRPVADPGPSMTNNGTDALEVAAFVNYANALLMAK